MKRSNRETHGIVSLPTLDVRARAVHASELGSQLLMGEIVRILGRDRSGSWVRVENETDGYRGWCRTWGLVLVGSRRAARWRAAARVRVVRTHVEARQSPRADAIVSPLTWNARVIAGRARAGSRPVELPDGRRGWVPVAALASGRRGRVTIAARARSLLGIPYMWGGRSALAFDCSGLTQQMLAEQGVGLPRDAVQQYRVSRALSPGETPREGDLVFFGDRRGRAGHVGLLLGASYYVQARGRVRINSLDGSNPLFDNELDGTILGVRRPVAERPRTTSRSRRRR